MNENIRKALLKMASWKLSQKLIGWALIHVPDALPIKILRQSAHWMAFCHPNPSYPVHIVLVPKSAWADLLAVDSNDPEIWQELIELAQSMIHEFELTAAGYRLITNGGPFQTFPLLHFYLVAGEPVSEKS
jgi:histidine triad (HIT) family protein